MNTTDCPLEFVRQDGERYIHRCPKCKAEARSRYRDPSMRSQPCGVIRAKGVGDFFFDITRELGIHPKTGCECRKLRKDMNKLGIEGVREQREKLVARLQKNAAKYGFKEWAAAGWSALWQGKPFTLAGLLDLAVVRATQSAREQATRQEDPGQSPRPTPP